VTTLPDFDPLMIGALSIFRLAASATLIISLVKCIDVYTQMPSCHFKEALRYIIFSNLFFVIWFLNDIVVIAFDRSADVSGIPVLDALSSLFAILGLVLVVMAMRKVAKFVDV